MKLIAAGGKVIALSNGARYLIYTGFTTDVVQGVLISVDAVEQINQVLADKSLTSEQQTSAIVRLLATLAVTGGLLAYGAHDLPARGGRAAAAIDDRIARKLDAAALITSARSTTRRSAGSRA